MLCYNDENNISTNNINLLIVVYNKMSYIDVDNYVVWIEDFNCLHYIYIKSTC